MQQPDPSQLRVSDADRHQVAEVLREAAAEGRLDLEELDERLEAAYKAKVYADLVPLTLDLPGVQDAGLQPVAPAYTTPYVPRVPVGEPLASPTSTFAMMAGIDRKGVWRVKHRHTAVAVMGAVVIDLRQAVFTSTETVINAYAFMGGIDVVVNAHTRVFVEGHGIMGDFSKSRDKVPEACDAHSPVVRVTGVALMGGVSVTRKSMPGEPRQKRKKLGGGR